MLAPIGRWLLRPGRPPVLVRSAIACCGAALLAPLVVVVFGADWRFTLTGRVFVTALVYSLSIGVPSGLVLPAVARRVGAPGARLALVMAATILVLAAAGSFAGGALLVVLGIHTAPQFWSEYWFIARITGALALAFGMSSYFYEALATQLRETRLKLEQKQLDEERARKLALEAKLASLESRIHPHFLFNTLNSISALIPVDPARAERIVGQLAALLRSSLNATRQPLIPLEAEIGIVRDYLAIEQARFGERLRVSVDVPEDARLCLVPPLSVQCLVENAVKHGVAPGASGGEVRIVARVSGAELRVEVRDTGPGFDLAAVDAGHGLDNLVSRLEMLFGSAARLEVARPQGRCVAALVVPLLPVEAPVR